MPRSSELPPHGTRARYLHRKYPCREPCCAAANTAYITKRRREQGTQPRKRAAPRVTTTRPDVKTHCPAGHEWNEENTRWVKNRQGELKWKLCKVCERIRQGRATITSRGRSDDLSGRVA